MPITRLALPLGDTERPVPVWAIRLAKALPFVVLPHCLWRLPFAADFRMGMVGPAAPAAPWWTPFYVVGLSALTEALALLTTGLVSGWGEVVPRWVPFLGGRRVAPFAEPRRRFGKDTVLIVDGTLVPTRDHTIAAQSKNYRYSTNHQVVIDDHTRLVVAIGTPLPGNRNDCKAWEESGAKAAVGRTTTIADGGYPGTGLVIPHRRPRGGELTDWQEEHNHDHKRVLARVEHVFARMKTWKILRDCRLKGDGVHHAMLGIARLHNLLQTA